MSVAKPVADGIEIVAGAEHVHGRRMAQGMGRDGLSFDLWISIGGKRSILLDDVSEAEAGDRASTSVEEQMLVMQAVMPAVLQVGLDGVDGLWPDRADARLSALAEQCYLAGRMKTEGIKGDRADLRGARASIIEEQEKGGIPDGCFGGEIHRGQEGLHLIFFEIGDGDAICPFELDISNSVAVNEEGGFFSSNETEEGSNGSETVIPRLCGATSLIL
jgi:hypothetical protein